MIEVITASGPLMAVASGCTHTPVGEPIDIDAPYMDRGTVVHLPKGLVVYGVLRHKHAKALLASDGLPRIGPARFPEGA